MTLKSYFLKTVPLAALMFAQNNNAYAQGQPQIRNTDFKGYTVKIHPDSTDSHYIAELVKAGSTAFIMYNNKTNKKFLDDDEIVQMSETTRQKIPGSPNTKVSLMRLDLEDISRNIYSNTSSSSEYIEFSSNKGLLPKQNKVETAFEIYQRLVNKIYKKKAPYFSALKNF